LGTAYGYNKSPGGDDEDWDEDEDLTDDKSPASPARRPEIDGDKVLSTPPPVELTRAARTHDIQCFSQVAASRGFFNTPSAIAQGNSYIAYKPEGNLEADWVPGQIQHIFSLHGKKKLAIRRSKVSSHHGGDAFARFQNLGFEAKLVSQSFVDKLEIIDIEWVVGHTARWNLYEGLAVILSLGRVRYSFPNYNMTESLLLRIEISRHYGAGIISILYDVRYLYQ
jgi:hypothetical protein